MPRSVKMLTALAVALLLGAAPARAQSVQITPFVGYAFGGSVRDTVLDESRSFDAALDYGGTLSFPMSEHWRFDAFRITERNVGVIVFGGGIPVPMWDKEVGYILVAYDHEGRAADVQYGLRAGGSWAGGESNGPASVTVTARDLQLRATGKETFLAVPPSRRDQYLQSLPSGTECRVVIGAPDSISDAALLIDGQPGPPLPKTMSDTLMPIRLAPGRHRIEVLLSGAAKAGVTEIQCVGGETHYAALRVLPGAGSSKHSSIEVVTATARPDWIEQFALLIWGNGHWLVEAEPKP